MVKPLNICIFVENRRDVFSGGRYHALHLAEALSSAGCHVDFVTNNVPIFMDEFKGSLGHKRINMHLTKDFVSGLPDGDYDAVVVTPSRSDNPTFYKAARLVALTTDAQIVLINFESANWFNHFAQVKRNERDWDHWRRVCAAGATVLSSNRESDKWARGFYTDFPDRTNFQYWCPPINSIAADAAIITQKENRAVIISRLSDPHKGMSKIVDLIPDNMTGWTLSIISGSGALEPAFENDLRKMGAERGLELEITNRPSDQQKFEQLKRAKVLLFPSLFEGYGYPPIEALYCNTEVVAFDLPVVRETCGDIPNYAVHGDFNDFREKLTQVVADSKSGQRDYLAHISELARMDTASIRAEAVFRTIAQSKNRTTALQIGATSHIETRESVRDRVKRVMWTKAPRLSRTLSTVKNSLHPAVIANSMRISRSRASSVLNKAVLEERGGISESAVHELGVVVIRGWRLGAKSADRIVVRIADVVEADAEPMDRPDIAKRYPEYRLKSCGFQLQIRYMDESLIGRPFEVLFYRGDKEVARLEGRLAATPAADVTWVTRMRAPRRKMRGRNVVLMTRFEDVIPGSSRRVDLLNVLSILQKENFVTHVIVQANPAQIELDPLELEDLCDEVIVADSSKPSSKQEALAPGSSCAQCSIHALANVQKDQVLAGVITMGLSMVEALGDAQTGARRIAYLFSSPTSEQCNSKKYGYSIWLDQADSVVVPFDSCLESPLLEQRDVFSLLLGSSAFGGMLPFANASSQKVMITSIDIPSASVEIHEFVEALLLLAPDVDIYVSGKAGENFAKFLIADRDLNDPMRRAVHYETSGFNFEAQYGNVALAVNPFIASSTGRGEELLIHRSTLEALARGRCILALKTGQLQAGQDALMPAENWGISLKKNIKELAKEAAFLLKNPEIRQQREQATVASMRSLRGGSLVGTPLIHTLETPAIPFGRIAVAPEDTLAASAAMTIAGSNPDLPRARECQIVCGQNLSVASAVSSVLESSGSTVGSWVSFEPGFSGNTFENRIIAPILGTACDGDASYVLASLDPVETAAWMHRFRSRGAEAFAVIPLVQVQERHRLAMLWDTCVGGSAVLFCDPDKPTPLKVKRKNTIWMASDVYCSAHQNSPVLKQLDFVIFTDPVNTSARWQGIAASCPDAQLVFGLQTPSLVGGDLIRDRMIRLDLKNLPWEDWGVINLSRTCALTLAVLYSAQIAAWTGCRSMIIRGADAKSLKSVRGLADEHGITLLSSTTKKTRAKRVVKK